MAVRNIIKIDEEKCNGCGECVTACAEGAIKIINGKAKLISESYCDGLGACIGHCPQDAITIEKRQASEFDEQATKRHLARPNKSPEPVFQCPGMANMKIRESVPPQQKNGPVTSHLSHWPVQLKLVSPQADFFQNADLLLVADCVPFAMGDFHSRFLNSRSVVVGCPKLDDQEFYIDKLKRILEQNKLKSLTAIHMEVPCCSGLTHIAKKAVAAAGKEIPFRDVIISLQGQVLETESAEV